MRLLISKFTKIQCMTTAVWAVGKRRACMTCWTIVIIRMNTSLCQFILKQPTQFFSPGANTTKR